MQLIATSRRPAGRAERVANREFLFRRLNGSFMVEKTDDGRSSQIDLSLESGYQWLAYRPEQIKRTVIRGGGQGEPPLYNFP